jgi:hypothetical protein
MPQGSHPPEARLDRYSKIGATEPTFVGLGTEARIEGASSCGTARRRCVRASHGVAHATADSRVTGGRARLAESDLLPPGRRQHDGHRRAGAERDPLSVRTKPFSRSAPVGRDPQSARSSSKIISGDPARSISDRFLQVETPTGSSLAMRESPCSRFAPPRPLNWSPGRAGRSCRRRARRRSRPRRAR